MNIEEGKIDIDFMEYWRIIEKRKWVVITFITAIILVTAIFTFTAVPQYRAVATLLVEDEVTGVMRIQDEFGNPHSVRDLRSFNTQLEMLKSLSLAARVAERMNLSSRSELLEGIMPKKSLFSRLKNIITLRWLLSRNSKTKESIPQRQSIASSAYAGLIRANLAVSTIRDTKIVRISYVAHIPRLSAEIVNTYAMEFMDFASGLKYARAEKFSHDLSHQIDELRTQIEDARRQRQKYATDKDLILSDSENAAYTDYKSISDAYTQAYGQRLRLGAILSQVRDSDVDLLASIDYPRIRFQQTEYLNAKNDYAELSQKYRENHPDCVKAMERLNRARQNLEQQANAYIGSDYSLALQEESRLKRQLESKEAEIIKIQSNIGVYRTLDVKVQSLEAQMISLQNTKTGVDTAKDFESLKESNISIVDEARVPGSPFSPNKSKNFILALLVGLFGGVGLCFLLDYLDNTIKGPEEVEKIAYLPSLGVIPLLKQEDSHGERRRYSEYGSEEGKEGFSNETTKPDKIDIELINHYRPRLPIADDFRTVRTSILLSHADSPPKVIAFTSSLAMEGKSSILTNLAVSFAQLDRKILVVDSDLRKPRLHRIFKIGNIRGLSGYLAGKVELKDAIQKTSVKNIWILPSGPISPNPSELLNSKKMKEMLEEVKIIFDAVFLDTSPVLATIDAVIISTLVDSAVLILKAGETTKKPFLSAVELLKNANCKILGVVFNALKANQSKYFYRRYYPSSRYGYYDNIELISHDDEEHLGGDLSEK